MKKNASGIKNLKQRIENKNNDLDLYLKALNSAYSGIIIPSFIAIKLSKPSVVMPTMKLLATIADFYRLRTVRKPNVRLLKNPLSVAKNVKLKFEIIVRMERFFGTNFLFHQ